MRISRERLRSESESTGFRAEVLEKVVHLLSVLRGLQSHPFLKDKLALKGGTALNLFVFDVPRLSVDIDLNYIGAAERDVMLQERPKVEDAVRAVCGREGLSIHRTPQDHAGGKWRLRYPSALGGGGNLELDLNFLLRIPLWPVTKGNSRAIGSFKASGIPLVDIHELAAGKLAALFSRHQSRDLFDAHHLLTRGNLSHQRLRLAFTVYGAMNRKDWRTVSIEDVSFETSEIENSLIPVLGGELPSDIPRWARALVEECRKQLRIVLPFTQAEQEFLDRILDTGEIEPGLLTPDDELADRIRRHPGLHWKAENVRAHKKKQKE